MDELVKKLLTKTPEPVDQKVRKKFLSDIPDRIKEEHELDVPSTEKRVSDFVEKLIARKGLHNKLLYQEGHHLLTDLSLDISGFTDQWRIDSYVKLIGLILIFWLYERLDNIDDKLLKAAVLKELARRHGEDSKRTEKRDDRLDKLAFQGAVRVNIEGYDTVEAAVQDLQVKPQFSGYNTKTLWKWARAAWTKPLRKGRPRKGKNNM